MTTAAETVAAALAKRPDDEQAFCQHHGAPDDVIWLVSAGDGPLWCHEPDPEGEGEASIMYVRPRQLLADLAAANERAERAEAEVVRWKAAISRQAAAVRTLHANEDTEINRLRRQQQESHQAIATLDSERRANAMLTAEVERLRDAIAAIEKGHDAYDMRETAIRALKGGGHD